MLKITIDNEEVLCDKDFTINEEMLNTSSTILNNVYPVEWEQDKDYTSRFYYPKDYSKCKIFDEIYHPEEREDVEGTSFSINVDTTKQYQVQTLKGQTTQSGTPTPSSPQPINITTGRQVVSVCGKNLCPTGNSFNGTSQQWYTQFGENVGSVSAIQSNAHYINLKPNTTYKFFIHEYNNISNVQIIYLDSTNTLKTYANYSISTNVATFTTTTYTKIWIRAKATANDNNTYFIGQLEEGTSTTYEEYKGNDYEINLGKNLLNLADGTYTSGNVSAVVNNGVITLNGTSGTSTSTILIPFTTTLNGTYTFSANNTAIGTSSNWTGMRLKASSSSTISSTQMAFTNANEYKTFTLTNQQVQYFDLRIGTSITFDNYVIKPQLEKGSQFTGYAPYKTPIYLGKIGTYQDYIFRNTTENPLYDSNLEEGQWYIHKEIGRVVLNGSETTINTASNNRFRVYLTTDYAKANSNTINVMSDKLIGVSQATTASTTQDFVISANNDSFFIRNTTTSSVANFKTWLSTNTPIVYYILKEPTNTLIEDEELINQLNSIELLEGLNNVSVSSPYLPFIMSLVYNYQEAYTEEDMLFCGIVKNTGEISLNPRYPHYCNIQVLDFKDFLSQGETLDFVISDKTIGEAIEQVIGTIAPYGFVQGNIELEAKNNSMGAYSTKDKTAYDVFNYLADITQSRWTTHLVDENTVAIDFYDTDKLPVGTQIEYDQTWFKNHKIDDLSFSYSSNDYRNKQVMLSGEVYSNIETTEIIVADGYKTQFNTIDKIGKVSSILQDGVPKSIITKDEYDLGYEGDFVYQPGNTYFESVNLVSTGAILTIVYYAIIEGREVILNQEEINLIEERTGRKGVVARYESRNDATTTGELQAIGQSYLEYKGIPEIKLNVSSRENTWNIGDRVYFNAPLDELKQTYMVKAKKIQRITTIDELFYQYELTSSFNMEQDINYFDNQRYKSRGNIGEGEFISRNIDIENTANVIFYDLEVQEVEITSNNTLQSELQSVLGGVE